MNARRLNLVLSLALAFTLGALTGGGTTVQADNTGAVVRALERIASALEAANRQARGSR